MFTDDQSPYIKLLFVIVGSFFKGPAKIKNLAKSETCLTFPRAPRPSPKVRHILGEIFYCIFELYSLCLVFRDQLIFFPAKM